MAAKSCDNSQNETCFPFKGFKTYSNRISEYTQFRTYNKETMPIIKYYINQNILKEIDGMQKIDQIYKEIRQIIDSLET